MNSGMKRRSLRDLGFRIGEMPPGPFNAITDVAGVLVGHATLICGDGALQPGFSPARTGVTVILPHPNNLYMEKVPAAVHTINGYGKAVGFEQVRELGLIEAPIGLTNTLNVGLALDALVQSAIRQNPQIGVRADSGSVNIVVGETNDSFLNDIQGRHVKAEHVWAALESAAGGAVQQGAVGAGTGTVCFGWKGGIGSASRLLPPEQGGYTLGVLVHTNFGASRDLILMGIPVGRLLAGEKLSPGTIPGSVMIVLATDAPLDARQLERVCVRAGAGLARTGAQFSHGSGDFVIAFSTANRVLHSPEGMIAQREWVANEAALLNLLFRAAIESVEEAVINSLFYAETIQGRDDHIARALPLEPILEILEKSLK